ncbi:MAG: DUF952 domain-containing protein [Ginsengibacter sp.]
MIYHITTDNEWNQALKEGEYKAISLLPEGYIHTSYDHQVERTLNRYYKNKHNLVLLHIDEDKVTSEIKYELAPSVNEIFPHIYGPLNTDAVIKVTPIQST